MADSIDLESMTIEDKYDGPKLENGTKVTKEFVDQLLEHYKNQKLLHKRYAFQILLDARTYFMSQTSLVSVTVSFFNVHYQGWRNDFYLGGARVIRKMRFCEFSKILLYKSPILGGARAPPAPPGPPPLRITVLAFRLLT